MPRTNGDRRKLTPEEATKIRANGPLSAQERAVGLPAKSLYNAVEREGTLPEETIQRLLSLSAFAIAAALAAKKSGPKKAGR